MNGKAKIDFDLWNKYPNAFSVMPKSCQNALIIEWLDSVGVTVIIVPYATIFNLCEDLVGMDGTWSAFVYDGKKWKSDLVDLKNRQEATEKAIEVAVNIYNEKQK